MTGPEARQIALDRALEDIGELTRRRGMIIKTAAPSMERPIEMDRAQVVEFLRQLSAEEFEAIILEVRGVNPADVKGLIEAELRRPVERSA